MSKGGFPNPSQLKCRHHFNLSIPKIATTKLAAFSNCEGKIANFLQVLQTIAKKSKIEIAALFGNVIWKSHHFRFQIATFSLFSSIKFRERDREQAGHRDLLLQLMRREPMVYHFSSAMSKTHLFEQSSLSLFSGFLSIVRIVDVMLALDASPLVSCMLFSVHTHCKLLRKRFLRKFRNFLKQFNDPNILVKAFCVYY